MNSNALNYDQVLDFIFNSMPDFQKYGNSALNYNLTKIEAILLELGNPHLGIKYLHVAGTNGKGSSSHMLASILQAQGYKTGLYTSPHLKNFTERIRINGEEITKDFVTNFINTYWEVWHIHKPSFFEMTTALAFYYFQAQKVDWAVIEVGLGGRLDSTNVIIPVASLITNISYDHMAILGNTLAKIASEKAGIIKTNIPVIISERQQETENVFLEIAERKRAPIYFAEDQIDLYLNEQQFKAVYKHTNTEIAGVLDLLGEYQAKNLTGVLQLIQVVRNLGHLLSDSAITIGLEQVCNLTGLKGRWQILNKRPLIICDTAHNEAGIKAVLKQVEKILKGKLFIVLGMVSDKDISKILSLLPIHAYYLITEANNQRFIAKEILFKYISNMHLMGEMFENVNKAIDFAAQKALPEDIVLVIGSNFLIAEIDNL